MGTFFVLLIIGLVVFGIWYAWTSDERQAAKLAKLTAQAREHMDPAERVEAKVLGAYEAKVVGQDSLRVGALIATDRRLIFYASKMFGYDLEVFPYTKISSIEAGKDLGGGRVSFFASGNRVSLKWVNAGELGKLVNIVRERIDPPKAIPVAAADPDIQVRLQQLASLREAGLLTDEEFSAKKADLLSRL